MYADVYVHIYKERERERPGLHESCTAAYVNKVKKALRVYVHMTHWVERNYTQLHSSP